MDSKVSNPTSNGIQYDVIPDNHPPRTLVLCFDGTGDCFDADVRGSITAFNVHVYNHSRRTQMSSSSSLCSKRMTTRSRWSTIRYVCTRLQLDKRRIHIVHSQGRYRDIHHTADRYTCDGKNLQDSGYDDRMELGRACHGYARRAFLALSLFILFMRQMDTSFSCKTASAVPMISVIWPYSQSLRYRRG